MFKRVLYRKGISFVRAGELLNSALLFFLIGMMASCAIVNENQGIQDPSLKEQWLLHIAEIQKLKQWQFSSRISVQHLTKRWSAALFWQQNETNFEIKIIGPLGQGALLLKGDENNLSVNDGKNIKYFKNYTSSDIESLYGINIPIKQLRHWVIGNPMADFNLITLNDDDLLKKVEKDRWQLDITKYRDINGLSLPKKMKITHPDWFIKLAILNWKISE
ncbi:MAG: outer membrane lipoprotein LolB [Methylococcales bacterium]|jgi:outer membrane lipoprotein LolB|nr:outer membrane lipoprotein LolB [Methylococcales bacterium]